MTAPQSPPPPRALRPLETFSGYLNRALAVVAGVALAAMTCFTVLDVVMRSFGRPIAGSFEVIGWMSAVSLALALGYTQVYRGHVSITLVADALRGRASAFVEAVNAVIAFLLFAAVAWYLVGYGQTLQESGSLSETLKALVYPWVYVVTAGFVGLALALLVDALRALARLVMR